MPPDFSENAEIKSVGIVVPDYFAESTEGLMDVRDGFQLMLHSILDEQDIPFQPVNLSLPEFKVNDDLPADIVKFFSVELDGHLAMNLERIFKQSRTHVVGIFTAKHFDEDMLERDVLRPAGLSRDDLDMEVRIYNILSLTKYEELFPRVVKRLLKDVENRRAS